MDVEFQSRDWSFLIMLSRAGAEDSNPGTVV